MAEDKSSRLPVAARQAHRGSTVDVRPLNCGSGETEGGRRCPRCKQHHLRPGYCQALDPINAAQYPEFHVALSPKMPKRHRAETATDNAVASDINHLGDDATDSVIAGATDSSDTAPNKPNATDNATDNPFLECETCGATFTSKRGDARYCSATYRSKAHRKGGAS
jgi:hypothetical protein